MKITNALPLVALAAFGAVGCDGGDEETASTERSSAYDRASAEVVPTIDDSAALLSGYNSVFDRSLPSCVRGEEAGAPFSVGNLEEKYEIKLITHRNELSKDLNVNLGLGLHLPKIELLPTFSLAKQVKNSKTSVSFVLSASQGYNVTNRRAVQLTGDALAAGQRSQSDFLKKCGNVYVHGLRYQADLLVLIRFDTMSEEKSREIAAGLSGKGSVGAAGSIDGNLQTALKNFAKTEGVSASVHVASTGFIASGNSDTATFTSLGTALTDETFAKIDQLRDAMARSIRNDVCRDGDEGTSCNGSTAPGYEKNTLRSARLSSITTRGYENATDEIDFATFRGNINRLKTVESFLGEVAEIGDKMETARTDEILPVVNASSDDLVNYNVKGAPRIAKEDVLAHAKKYATAFSTENGSSLQKIRDIAEECASYALAGDYGRCSMTAQSYNLRSPQGMLESYKKERLVRLRYKVLNTTGSKNSAEYYCGREKSLGEHPKLPSKDEVAYLAPYLRSAGSTDVWYTDGSCGGSAFFDADGSVSDGYRCFDPGWKFWESKKARSICAPAEGLVGEIQEL